MPKVTRLIRQQHRAMASVLLALRALTRQALRSGNRPDFFWPRTLTGYVERYPKRLHHPNEETYLHRVLLHREPGTARLVARLRRDHAASAGYANRLRDTLADWERGNHKAGLRAAHVANGLRPLHVATRPLRGARDPAHRPGGVHGGGMAGGRPGLHRGRRSLIGSESRQQCEGGIAAALRLVGETQAA
jgi:Hemerythrin HHE cation binding domain